MAGKPETNKPTGNPVVLLPQDPTVCQTLNHAITPPPFQNHHWLVLGQGNNTTTAIC